MQIVIDIPETYYKECVDVVNSEKHTFYITEWIAKGTPLPKHGRLIDADALSGQPSCIRNAPTILEAEMDEYIEKEHPTLLLSSVNEDEYRDVLDDTIIKGEI